MFSKLKHIFSKTPKVSENITDISDALAWIKTYRKAGNYTTAITAAKELVLKSQTSITYYESALRKIAVLENTNVESISKKAKEKHAQIDAILSGLHKELNSLDKLIADIEKERTDKLSVEEQKIQRIKFKQHVQEIQKIITKKDYLHALSFAKKLVSDFPNEK